MPAEGNRRSPAFPRIRTPSRARTETAVSIRGLWAFTSTRRMIATPRGQGGRPDTEGDKGFSSWRHLRKPEQWDVPHFATERTGGQTGWAVPPEPGERK